MTAFLSSNSLAKNGFTFKQFFIAHDRCAMKVGTDSIILAAWSGIESVARVLDIGSGSGLLAIMLAQRTATEVLIDAVELDAIACQQARENVAASPWPKKIEIIEQDIVEYAQSSRRRYDLIVSNPPYFAQGVDCRTEARSIARYTLTLNHQLLLDSASSLLSEHGRFCVVLPQQQAKAFLLKAELSCWWCSRLLSVKDSLLKEPYLQLLELKRAALPDDERQEDELVIRQKKREYSQQFRQLTGEFYLFTR